MRTSWWKITGAVIAAVGLATPAACSTNPAEEALRSAQSVASSVIGSGMDAALDVDGSDDEPADNDADFDDADSDNAGDEPIPADLAAIAGQGDANTCLKLAGFSGGLLMSAMTVSSLNNEVLNYDDETRQEMIDNARQSFDTRRTDPAMGNLPAPIEERFDDLEAWMEELIAAVESGAKPGDAGVDIADATDAIDPLSQALDVYCAQ